MTLTDLLQLLRTNVVILFVAASLGVLGSFVHTTRQPTVFAATATGYVAVGIPETVEELASNSAAANAQASAIAQQVGSPDVAAKVREKLGDSADFGSLVGTTDGTWPVITATANAASPAGARDAANAAVDAAVARVAELADLSRPQGEPPSSLVKTYQLQAATAPTSPIAPKYPLAMLQGLIAGLVIGFVIALLRKTLDSRMRTVADVDEQLGVGTLGILPESPHLQQSAARRTTGSAAADETLRQLRTNVRFMRVDSPPRSIVITSANAAEGKSTVALNLARAIAESGQHVVLVDADMRRPTVAGRLGLDEAVGLSQVLSDEVDLATATQSTDLAALRVIVAGRTPPNPSELLGTQRMAEVIRTLSEEALVILDAPPLLPVTDAGLLSTHADGVLLVVRVGHTYKEASDYCRRILLQLGVPMLGVVLNRAPVRGLGSVIYGRGYGNRNTTDYYAARSTARAEP